MALTEFSDPYLDPKTGVLRNQVGARTRVALDEAEAEGEGEGEGEGDLMFSRLVQLPDKPPRATGDLGELRAIHRQLFQDIYPWAGKIRTVDIKKNDAGSVFFLPVSMIERAAHIGSNEGRPGAGRTLSD